jgi:hypothetical protein
MVGASPDRAAKVGASLPAPDNGRPQAGQKRLPSAIGV